MNTNLLFLFLGTTLAAFGYGTLVTIPVFVLQLGGNEAISGAIIGVIGFGTITSVFVSQFLLRRVRADKIALCGSGLFAAALFGLSFIMHLHWTLLLCVIAMGFGWGFIFNSIQYILTLLTPLANRSLYFNYLAALIVLGGSLAPTVMHWLWEDHINFAYAFNLSSILCVIALFSFSRIQLPPVAIVNPMTTNRSKRHGLHILTSVVWYPLAMTALGGCVFTMMVNFQMSYAQTMKLNYSYFYITYSLFVVIPRIFLSKSLARLNQYYLSIVLSAGLVGALVVFIWAHQTLVIYIIATALLGVSYGLLYPTVQAITVNLSRPEDYSDVVSYFSLAYFLAVYLFPILGGFIIVHSGYRGLLLSLIVIMILETYLAVRLWQKLLPRKLELVKE